MSESSNASPSAPLKAKPRLGGATVGRIAGSLIVFTVCLAGCSTQAVPAAPLTEAETISWYRALYDSGFHRVIAALPPDTERPDLAPLHDLARFRSEEVAWAEVRDGEIQAVENGVDGGGWLAVVPADEADPMPATLMMSSNASVALVLVGQRRVSQLWAGIFLVHELSHLSDRVHHVEEAGATGAEFLAGERRAFELEAMAANLVSRGALVRKLDELLDAWHPHSLDEVVERGVKMGERDFHALDETVSAGISQSEHEAGMRKGFFLAALLIREGQRSAAAPATVLQAIDVLMQHNQP